jgi:rubrerythrin
MTDNDHASRVAAQLAEADLRDCPACSRTYDAAADDRCPSCGADAETGLAGGGGA